jgi:dTDP-4-amino-4,6-dideoxygalactose transaminase
MINVFQPSMGDRELELIAEAFKSNWVGKGEFVRRFEEMFASAVGVNPSLFTTTTCCTEGIFLAAELFDFGPNDEIIAPAVSFVAVGSAVRARGARLVLCDVDERTLNATAATLAPHLTERTKAVILNHYGGWPCEMDEILSLCRDRGIAVIEDAACAIQGLYKGKACGTMGDMGLWSFDSMKTLSTGDGGGIYLPSEEAISKAKEHLYLGQPARQKSGMDNSSSGAERWWEYQVTVPGRRAIMNNVAGAIGVAQMEKLPDFMTRRRELVDLYRRELTDIGWLDVPPMPPTHISPSPYFFWIQTDRRDELAQFLLAHGVYATFRYWPLNRVSHFGVSEAEVPQSEKAADRTLNLPLHPSLSDDEVGRIIELILEFGKRLKS